MISDEKGPVRTVNLKLVPTQEQIIILSKYIDDSSYVYARAYNLYVESKNTAYLKIKGSYNDFITAEQRKKLKDELTEMGIFPDNRTHFSSVLYQDGAPKYYKTLLKKIKSRILYQDKIIQKLEEKNPNLLKPRSVWFNPIKNSPAGQQCYMCGTNNDLHHQSSKPEFSDEYLCDVCFEDYKDYRKTMNELKRHGDINHLLYPVILQETETSHALKQLATGQKMPVLMCPLKIQSNKAFNWANIVKKIDFTEHILYIKIRKNVEKIQFEGEFYYLNYPKYGHDHVNKRFIKLIDQHINVSRDNSWILRKAIPGNQPEFFLSIPARYPVPDRGYPVGGCIIVSNRSVLVYVNGNCKFIKLRNHYLRKRIYVNRVAIARKNNDLLVKEGKPPVPVPKRYSEGNVARYIRFQNHLISRKAVETAKKLACGRQISIRLVDYIRINASSEKSIVPITALNDQIKHKLNYDDIFADEIFWKSIGSVMKCSRCGRHVPEREEGSNRLVVRDILLSAKNEWMCSGCGYSVNPLIMVAINLLNYEERKK